MRTLIAIFILEFSAVEIENAHKAIVDKWGDADSAEALAQLLDGGDSPPILLIGSFLIGWITGAEGLARIESFIVSPFQGVLCLFLLDMGLVAGRGLRDSRGALGPGAILFGVIMPPVGAVFGLAAAMVLGLSVGGTALLMTLAASASYIAVPAAMRVALPEANPAIYLTLSLGVTFPFNLTVGIPLYTAIAAAVAGG